MIFNKSRFEIWDQTQHPFKHSLADFSFVNPALPGVSNLEGTINWILAVLYPQTKPSVATVGDLPSSGNTINDYRVVLDDGDGKAASYRWEQREGEVAASWHKIYDMDWGQDSILAAFQDVTQDLYVHKNGKTDLDNTGAPITGIFAGQSVFGGNLANQNLTLKANSGDGTGAHTGFVQVDDQFRPTTHNAYDIGTNALRFRDLFIQNSAIFGSLLLQAGVITDSSGQISFDNENIITTGNITGAVVKGTTSLVVDDSINSVTLVPGSYSDTSGAVTFGAAALVTTGTLGAGVTTLTKTAQTLVFDPLNAGKSRITSSTGTIDFDNENIETTGNFLVGNITSTQIDVDNMRLDGNTLSVTQTNGNLFITANGTGKIIPGSEIDTSYLLTSTANIETSAQVKAGNLRLSGNSVESTNTDGNINLDPNGVGVVVSFATIKPTTNNNLDLGTTSEEWKDIYFQGDLKNGTNIFSNSDLFALRSTVYRDLARTQPAQAGDALFYDSVNNIWLANHPDTEIDHSEVTGLVTGDAGHTQFVMLAGRSGGQSIQGGTQASNNLVLESTANATKGNILFKDTILPFTAASFSGVWSGLDIGSASNPIRDIFSKGELKGARLENYTFATLPASSGQNVGRLVYATDLNKAYVDTGAQFKVLGVSKFIADQTFNGTQNFKDVTVSSDITDARNAIWQLRDNANNFEILNVTILTTSASNVRITTSIPLPAGAYRLIGVE